MAESRSAEWTEGIPSRRVVVMGMARTGRAAAAVLARRGAEVVATDMKDIPGLREELPREVALELGGHREETFRRCDVLVVSPGIPATDRFIRLALASGAEVISEIELAWRLCPAPVAAVTGTNGKTTATTMLGAILEEAGFRAPVGGNIGRPLVDVVEKEGQEADFVVSEVSSFQLEWAPTLRPRVGVITNVTPDHLDRHPDMDGYAAVKARLLANQGPGDAKVLNADDPFTARYLPGGRQAALAFSRTKIPEAGAYVEDGWIYLRIGGDRQRVCAAGELAVPGVHNLENFLAACAAAGFLGAGPDAMARLARRFKGLPHRMEPVAEIGGVRWVNDSKGTNVGATAMSLESVEGPVLLIAGGTDKGSDLSPMIEPMRKRVRTMVLIGEAADRFEAFFRGRVPVERAATLHEAVRRCAAAARPGDTVLLSPACASFDQFRDYAHRGDVFREAVRALAKEGAR
ncbi:MAG: UDP-N-acetylmuramoyl-L-alanine--D-glutamate ligase [Candidatus Tectomicrobia bacterium]|uniref:UDP-N-acetylmuramoylalanine--D-glutamate ligase n=1 Tax=Tectimicrobiota bacterium TaxID=2528274 RepID=A0A932MPV1_UNCTE|nr:UDP-N-acetylmuramoyl-L-alanine--D-glutamate ligase [Candidatus Tectomicrobia bacterium]